MTTFDDREKGFENKYAHDQELAFRTIARRHKLLGLWAAQKLGKSGAAADTFAKNLAIIEIEGKGSEGVVEALLANFKEAGLAVTSKDIHIEMERLLGIARKEVLGEAN